MGIAATFWLCVVAALSPIADAYIIDASCNANTIEAQYVQQALTCAFDQAQAGLTSLNQNPLLPNYDTLTNMLFNLPAGLGRVRTILSNVVGMNHVDTNRQSPDTVIIYCDLSRITRNVHGDLWDPDIQGPLMDTDGYNVCASTDNRLSNLRKGATVAYVTADSSRVNGRAVQQIQICAWYAKLMAEFEFQSCGRFNFDRLALKLGMEAIKTLPSPFTQMDTLSLLDNTLLHELTHTRTGGGTSDVGGPNKAYGWKSIVNNLSGSFNNADSIAYYGLGCALINQGSVPQRDGTLRKCTPNTLPGIPAVGGGGGGAPPRIRSVDRYKEFES